MTKCNLKVLVTRIIMEGDKAVGVELKQGKKVELMRKAIVLNLMLMNGPKILILYTTWRHWVTLMATLQSMNSNRLQRSKKDLFILSLSLPFDLKYVELWHARVLLLYNTNHLTIFYAEVGKKFSRSQWSLFPGKADQSRRGDLEWGGHQLSSATLALRCLLIIISMITMLMMEVMTIATLNLVVGDGHVKFLLSCQTENFLALDIDITWNFLLIQGSDQGTTWKR